MPGSVCLLKGIRSHQTLRHVSGDKDHGRRIHICRRNRRHQIGRAGAARGDAHARLSAGAGIAVRRVTRVLLMRCQHMLNSVLTLIKFIINGQNRAAGKTKHRADVLLNQAFNQNRRSVEFHLIPSLLRKSKKQPFTLL